MMSGVNSIRPDARAVSIKQKASSHGNNHETLSTVNLIDAITVRLERLEQLEEENKNLKQQLQSSLTSKESDLHDISRTRQLLAEKQNEVQRLRERNATMAEKKLSMDQRRTENTLSRNRQSDLEREYKDELRDGKRMDAIDIIEAHLTKIMKKIRQTSVTDQLQAYRLACLIFETSYECTFKARETFVSYYSSVLETLVTEAPTIGSSERNKCIKFPELKTSLKKSAISQDSVNEVMVLVKEEAVTHNLEMLVKTVTKAIKDRWRKNEKTREMIPNYDKSLKNDLKGYIEYCTRFSWRIVTQVPPLKIDYISTTFSPSYHIESQAFASSAQRGRPGRWGDFQQRKQIKCYVWPILFDSDNRVIEKGDVVLAEHSLYSSFV